MGLPLVIKETCDALGHVRDELRELQVIIDDHPTGDSVLLVDQIGLTVEDLLGWCEESLQFAVQAWESAEKRKNYRRAGHELGDAHERFIELDRRYHDELASYDRLSDLSALGLGREKEKEWLEWSRIVASGVVRCHPLLTNSKGRLLSCWREFVEWAAGCLGRSVASYSNAE